jgi:hypothetical protein
MVTLYLVELKEVHVVAHVDLLVGLTVSEFLFDLRSMFVRHQVRPKLKGYMRDDVVHTWNMAVLPAGDWVDAVPHKLQDMQKASIINTGVGHHK